jgi:hypothetical protein
LLQELNFPFYDFKLKRQSQKIYIFDIARKKYVLLTPEEWVRQHVLHYLVIDKHYPVNLIAVEKQLMINKTVRRFDLVVFNKEMQPDILIECKAPGIPVNQKTFDQANQYNHLLKAPYLFLTNGRKHYICQIDFEENKFQFLPELPDYNYR